MSPEEVDVRWSALTIDQLIEEYWATVAPAMRADGMDPEAEHPPHRWVKDGFAGLIYTLREHHDRTPTEFFRGDVGIIPSEGYEWELDDDAVAIALDRHVEALREQGLAESTIEATRSRLAAYARRFERRNDVSLIESHDREIAVETLSRVVARYVSRDAKRHLVKDVRTLYAWLAEEAYHEEHVLDGVGLDDLVEGS
ncbi:phage integrase [Halorubrum saccharovorum DSM 1137]|uniref:Phage integrase n=1 Tax=Halorubrum saccharovorum DSM 1137 TaxID=1227484 RepID=M0DNP1_9EURY|nr:hypothetical protein [Halorubrum saccharovorum]ELZ35769.1 phage integrase [Halorubrum saccharovorum DSM 1137]